MKRFNTGAPIVLLAARLLESKGVKEFVHASKLVNATTVRARFVLVGEVDLLNPESIQQQELDQWDRDGIIEVWGYRKNMHNILSLASIVVLPSYYGEGLPKEVKLDKNLLERGKQRYGIYCAVCHAESGDGNGVVRPFGNGGQIPIANLHEARFAETSYPDGEVFSVITMGKGLMGGYGGSIPAKDRWAIIAYVRALQKAKLDSEKTVEGNSPASTEDKPSEN